ncbi:TRAP transporter large permease [Radicibacter daui]|uniref:TRAP transporter large permease n=1 Tax=Radicibacter daui TaxID=3064829 RepID=UPI0040470231
MIIAIFLVVLLAFMALGMPIAFALMLSGIAMMIHLGYFDSQLLAQNMLAGADNFPLMAVPFFMLAGELMNAGGLSRRIVDLAVSLVGHMRGGLGYVAIGTAVVLASLSGSAIADTAALAALLVPMMKNNGYRAQPASALVAAGGIIGPVIPPSLPFIIFGVATNTSITRLFFAGVMPGILMGVVLVLLWARTTGREAVTPSPRQSWGERWTAFRRAGWALMLPVLIIGGLRGGLFTPTEAAVVAAAYALIVSLLVYRELKLPELLALLISASKTTAVVLFLCAAALVTAYMITLANLPGELAGLLGPLLHYPRLFMLAVVILLLLVGTAMDLTPTILILGPVLMPLAVKAHIDPVYFGVMFVLVGVVGLLTPPVGSVLSTVCGITRVRMEQIVPAVMPYVAAYTGLIGLFILFPQLITVPARWLY